MNIYIFCFCLLLTFFGLFKPNIINTMTSMIRIIVPITFMGLIFSFGFSGSCIFCLVLSLTTLTCTGCVDTTDVSNGSLTGDDVAASLAGDGLSRNT